MRTPCLATAFYLFIAGVSTAAGQDQFGQAVAVLEGQVLITKPAVGRGPAGVIVFERAGDAWREATRLAAPRSADTGEGLSPSLAVDGDRFLTGSGDPATQEAAHLYQRNEGSWSLRETLPFRREAPTQLDAENLDFPAMLRLLQPPARTVSLDGDRALAGMVGGTGREPVRVLERSREGWSITAELDPPEGPDARFGQSLLLADGLAFVGAPGFDESGAVFLFALEEAGTWRELTVIRGSDLPSGSAFGAALALHDGFLAVGAPGTSGSRGAVLLFDVAPDGSAATERQRLAGPDPQGAFGAALALSDEELWVGAPLAADRTGALYRWQRDGAVLNERGPVALDGAQPGAMVGTALALEGGVAASGAPGADGGHGRAAIFVREGEAWSLPQWVEPMGALMSSTGNEVICEEDQAAGFECNNVDLLSFLSLSDLGAAPGERVSDLWGWTDPETGREYALVGRTAGAALVDVTQASAPVFVGLVPANPSGARDLKVYRDHLFFTGDGAGEHGLVVFDLTRLRDGSPSDGVFTADTVYRGIASAHNLVLDPGSGFAFPVGASGGGETCGGGLHMVDVRTPKNPTFAGCFTDTEGLIWQGRTHDAQCVIYSGPDTDHQGKEICFASNETAIRIVDVSDKTMPTPIGVATYPGRAYVHQGWLSEDQRYFYMNDELDELVGTTSKTRTYIWDVAELDDPILVSTVDGPDGSTDHNLYVKGDRMYQANYQAGFRVYDLTDPENPEEIGYFDTTPYEGNPPGFIGAWTAYPFFDSGTVIVSSMHEGLFLLRPRGRALVP